MFLFSKNAKKHKLVLDIDLFRFVSMETLKEYCGEYDFEQTSRMAQMLRLHMNDEYQDSYFVLLCKEPPVGRSRYSSGGTITTISLADYVIFYGEDKTGKILKSRNDLLVDRLLDVFCKNKQILTKL